ncbi:MAG TPA: hypothetical protein VKR32_12635 [Puia sp.]|nr:hypothetical protein [Puia sp.]
MTEEKKLTEKESLEIITSMITRAKCAYDETGVSALMWGIIVVFCSLVTFFNDYLHWQWLNYVWLLTAAAVIPQVVIAIRERRRRRYKSYDSVTMSAIWISFGVGLLLFSYFAGLYNVPHAESVYLMFYGIPTFTTGMMTNFKPMTWGGIACWVICIISFYVHFPDTMLLTAIAAIIAWFIPGLMLRAKYLQLKKENV